MSAILTALVTLAAIAVGRLTAKAIVDAQRKVWTPRDAARRERWHLVAAIGPALAGIGFAFAIVLPAFILFEPRRGDEPHGLVLPALAAAGAVTLAGIVRRAIGMVRLSRMLSASWSRAGEPHDHPRWGMPATVVDGEGPLVAVAGFVHPRLFVDRRVLDMCTAAELDAIAAHERAHVTRRDNLRRLLIGACSDARSATAAAWRSAAELVADERAARTPREAVDLASALIKVSRMQSTPLDTAPVSTILDSNGLALRIHRLLERSPAGAPSRPRGHLLVLVVGLAVVATAASGALQSVHAGVEFLVRHLP